MKRYIRQSNTLRLIERGIVLLIAILFWANMSFGQITLVTGSPQSNTTTGTTLTITKPSGLAIGDVLIANIMQTDNDWNNLDDALLNGWTEIAGGNIHTNNNNSWRGTLLYRIVVAADVVATNFTFTLDNNADDGVGAVVAFRGVDITGGFNAAGTANSGPFDVDPGAFNLTNTTSITATSITTNTAGAAVIMFGQVANNRNFSNWQTATSPGALTELYDKLFDTDHLDMGVGAAWAIKDAVGSTGTGTAVLSDNDRKGGILIALKPLCTPVSQPSVITGLAAPCVGSSQTYSVTNVAGVTYTWAFPTGWTKTGGGTANSVIVTVGAGTGNISVTPSKASCDGTPRTLAVTPSNVLASVSITSSANPICAGTSVTFTATPTNGGTAPVYQWKLNGTNVGGGGATYTNASLANGNTISCVLTSNATCPTGSPATSNTVTMTVNPNLPVSVSIAAVPSGAICTGTPVTFTATPVNGGAAPTYQWYNGATAIVGATGPIYSSATLSNENSITVRMTSNASSCATGSPASSNAVIMIINAAPVITLSKTDESCPINNDGVINTNLSGGLSNIRYVKLTQQIADWTNLAELEAFEVFTGTNVALATNGAVASASSIYGGGAYPASEFNDGISNLNGNMWHSGSGTSGEWVKIDLGGAKNIDFLRIHNRVDCCQNRSQNLLLELFDASNNLVYSKVINVYEGIDGAHFIDVNVLDLSWMDGGTTMNRTGLNAGTYTINYADGIGCTTSASAIIGTTNSIPAVPTANAGSGAMCTQITANWSSSANATSYQLDVSTVNTFASFVAGYQNLNVGNVTNSSVTGLTAGTTYYYRLRAVNSCGTSASSNTINYSTLVATPAQPSTITGIQTPCIGSSQIYSVTNVAGVTYTWTFPAGWAQTGGGTTNSVNVTIGANSGNVVVTPSTSCGTGTTRVLAVTVIPTVGTPTAITISAGTEPTCQLTNGTTTTTYSTTATNNTGFNWSINNAAAGSINPTTGVMTWANGFSGNVNIQVTANGCNGPSSQIIRAVTVTPLVGTPVFDSGAASIYCKGAGSVTYTATATNNTGITYSLDAASLTGGNSIVSGTGVVTYVAGWGGPSIITATATGCNGSKSATHTVTINDAVPVSVSITESTNRVCAGTPVTFTAIPVNGGTTPFYQWKVNGANVGPNSATYTYGPLNNDVVSCVMTSSIPCVSGNPATSNAVLMIPWITNNYLDFPNGNHGIICATPEEYTDAVLTAPAGTHFINVGFASYGTPDGTCPSFTVNINCNAATSQSVVEGYLLGNNSATFPVTNDTFGDPCPNILKRLYVRATYAEPICAGTLPGTITGTTPTGGDGVGTYTYLWESSTSGPTSGFAAASGINTTPNYTPAALTQTTWYRRKVTSGACSDYSAVILIKVTPLPVATFSYPGTPFCSNEANPAPLFSGGGVAGTFSSIPAGLVFVSTSTGEVNLGASTPGNYTVTNSIAAAGGCGIITATSPLSITALPIATFNYTGSPFCSAGVNPTPSFSGGGVAGTFSSTGGLSLNPANGQINLAASTPGTYTVTNTIAATGGCGIVTATSLPITITALPVATISYTGTPFCTSVATAQPVTRTGTAGGTYSASPAGLTINGASGAITPAGSNAGTYTVTYTIAPANGCGTVTTTTSVTITAVPTATISYAGAPFCKSVSTAQPVTLAGTGAYAGGTYSASAGLIINTTTGAITPSLSTAGTYTVTYTTPASAGCAAIPATTSVTITTMPVATFSYATPLCQNAANPMPALTGSAGVFTSTSGLNFVSTATGQINLATSTPGTYTVTNTIGASGGCALVSATSSITITALPKATFSYIGSPYCSNAANPSPTLSIGGSAGTFTSTPGLNFVSATTGQINLTTSTPGTYTVTNTIIAAGGCAIVSSASSVTITKLPVATFNYAGTPYCSNAANPSPVFTGGGVAGAFSSTPAGLVFVNTATGQVDMTLSAAGTYTVTNTIAAAGGCEAIIAQSTIIIKPRPTISLDYCANPGTIQLTATGGATATSYVWQSPLSGNTNTAVTDIAGVYGVQVTNGVCVETIYSGVSNEMVVNGDFTAGNTGFTSGYTYYANVTGNNELVPDNGTNGYGVGTNGQDYHANFWGTDHTNNITGNKNFMLVNGHGTITVWSEGPITVIPGRKYYFSAWAISLNNDGNNANLQFNVNGSTSGLSQTSTGVLPSRPNNNNSAPWTRFYGNWIAPAGVTSATISIVDLITVTSGNDFGLDDISFGTMDPFPAVLTSAPSTVSQNICINTPMVDITYSTTGATGAGISWTPSLPAGITCVFANNEAKISGIPTVAGTYSYTMTLSGCGPTEYKTGTLVVTPNAGIASVTGTSPLCIAGTATYTANSVVLGGGTGVWSSSNTAIATVNASGLVTGIAAGTCDIIYTIAGGCGGTKSAQKSVTINPNASIGSITGTTPLCIAGTATFTTNSLVLSGGTGAWSSSNTAVATVNSSGLVTGVAAGNCNIIYTITGGCGGIVSASQAVTINPNASITSVTGSTSLCIGGTATYAANSVVLGGGTGAWSSSNNAVATVSTAGLVTGVSAGNCNIIYTITGGCSGTKSAQQLITITPNASIGSVSGTTPLCPGATATYTAGSVILSGGTGAWSSSNTAIATVNSSGSVTGISAGTCNIIYTITGGCGGTTSKQQSITVNANASIASVTGATPLCSGSTANYLVNTVNLGGSGTGAWSSSNTLVATVNASGLVTGVSPGTCNIIYTVTGGCGGTVSAQQTLTISQNASVGSVTGTSPLCIAANATYLANAVVLSGGTGSWSSSSTVVATVDPITGVVTGVSAGTCDIIFTISGGCGGTVSKLKSVTITPGASIASLSGALGICVGGTTTYAANGVVFSGGTGAWSSSNTSVATVNPSTGLVMGLSAGTSDIIYTITGGCGGTITAHRTVTVAAPITQTITGTSPLCVGSAAIWTGTTAGGTWTSATPAVATVNNVTGLVTGVTAGTSVITYAYSFGGCVNTATKTITIVNVPTATITYAGTPYCTCDPGTKTVTLNGTGAYTGGTYSSTAGLTIDGTTGTVTPGSSSEGIYTVTYTIPASGSCSGVQVTTLVRIVIFPVISCPANIAESSSSGICTKSLDPGNRVLIEGTLPITSYSWTMTGATLGTGTGNIGPRTFNRGVTTITWTATNIAGTSLPCSQTVTITDNQPPTFILPAVNLSYCVNNLISAVYNAAPTDPNYDDLTTPRPDYYKFIKSGTEFNLDPGTSNFADNCCAVGNLKLHWRIVFSPIPNPADPAHGPITKAPITDQIGQPSAYPADIEFPGDGVNFNDITHKIFYWLEDCDGNSSAEKTLTITIKPRPNIIKTTI